MLVKQEFSAKIRGTWNCDLIFIMKPLCDKHKKYQTLKEELFVRLPEDHDISGYKDIFVQDPKTMNVISRRKMDQISTLSQLLTEFENQMLIFPERRGIKHFFKIVEYIRENSTWILPEYFTKVKTLTEELQPEDPVSYQTDGLREPISVKRMSIDNREYVFSELSDSECQSGRHLIFALGKCKSLKVENRNIVRIRQGEFDKIERDQGGDYKKTLLKCFEEFERRCQKKDVAIDVTQHIIDLLQDDWKYIADKLRSRIRL